MAPAERHGKLKIPVSWVVAVFGVGVTSDEEPAFPEGGACAETLIL